MHCARPSPHQVPSLCRQSNRMVRRKCWDQGWEEAVSPLAVLGLDLLFPFLLFLSRLPRFHGSETEMSFTKSS